ncbi:hypothetical protein FE257_000197 [Aspergillus nanangensis]|uniref:Glucose-methanol-choline oxidoreductase N-terminal domain-containing protein n=1 Tax=Aspergillus nanangensis TaxID=2582783 RepID=A0AAD4D0P6_ASPNN|nr:hypothetical protein FE257_000197 [Aspergillus nanangensis]
MTRPDTESAAGLEHVSFDFVVIGGGTSGLVVANRLTENPKINVLVLEAGTNRLNDPRLQVPALGVATFEDPDFDWDFKCPPQSQLNGRQLLGNKGRTLGGSSAINLGMIVYPSKIGLNAWEELGNPGWGWDDVVPYIRKFQTGTAPSESVRQFFGDIKYDAKAQGTDGPVCVSFGDEYMPFHGAWMETFRNLGFPQTEDTINGAGTGAFVSAGAVDPATHTRSHAGVAYFNAEVQARSNLRVVTGAMVQKLVLEPRDDTVVATAVEFSKDDQTFTIPVRKEVIMAAGTTQTPQLLELSGIGNANLLRSHGITPVVDNPGVGENLQDHGIVSFGYEVADGMPSGDMSRDPAVAAAAMAAYQKDGSGPLGMVPFVSAFMPCLETSNKDHERLLKEIDTQIEGDISRTHKQQYKALRKIMQDPTEPTSMYILAPSQLLPRKGSTARDLFSLAHPGFFISILSLLSHPFSRGSVHIQSADPRMGPRIDHGILRHPVDLELHARHNIWMDKIAETEPMASLLKPGGTRLHTPDPVADLAQSQELCKELVLTMYHLTGTCVMMPREDGGVVDPRLRVYGTANIRIVDASIFPLEPRGNTQATVFAVAEKAADIIKEGL